MFVSLNTHNTGWWEYSLIEEYLFYWALLIQATTFVAFQMDGLYSTITEIFAKNLKHLSFDPDFNGKRPKVSEFTDLSGKRPNFKSEKQELRDQLLSGWVIILVLDLLHVFKAWSWWILRQGTFCKRNIITSVQL